MSVQFQDYYAMLGVERSASQEEIKKAFRKIARTCHPDLAKSEDKATAEAKFKEINEAYEVLSDTDKRKKYDTLGTNWRDYESGGKGAGRGHGYSREGATHGNQQDYEFHFGGTGFSDFFEQYFSGGHGDFGTRASSSGRGYSMRGHDVEAEILVTLEEAFKGSQRQVSLRKVNPQTGQETTQTYQVKIPVGVREGQRIRLSGQGESGVGQGTSGDLFLRVRMPQHPFLQVKGETLYYDLELTPWEAVLGATIPIRTLDGEVRVKVQPATQNGQHLRLKGLGMPAKNGTRGDLHVLLSIEVPKSLNPSEQKLWEELASTSDFNPRKDQS